jgi:hypothetical protein
LPAAAVTHPKVTFLRYALAVVTEGTIMQQAQATHDLGQLYDLIWAAYAANYFPAPAGSPRDGALAAVFGDALANDYTRPDAASRLQARAYTLIYGAISQTQWRLIRLAQLNAIGSNKDALASFVHDLYQAHALTLTV